MSEVKEDNAALDSVYLKVDLLELEGMKGALVLEDCAGEQG